jgi:hypothetical protein
VILFDLAYTVRARVVPECMATWHNILSILAPPQIVAYGLGAQELWNKIDILSFKKVHSH